MIPISQPYITDMEKRLVMDVLDSGWLVEGKYSQMLERELSSYIGVKEAVTVTNGTVALQLALEALGLKPGDEVITTAFTFVASSNAAVFIGGVPIFADISKSTFNLDPEDVRRKVTKKTKAIVAVHIFGLPCDVKALREIADEYGLYLIEDCAQAHGATVNGGKVGSFGDVSCFSFYATKIVASGEGGLVATNDSEIADRVRMLKNHGRGPEGGYRYYRIGYNFRMTDYAAAIALGQLRRIDELISVRRRNAKIILSHVEDTILDWQHTPEGYGHAYYILALRLPGRPALVDRFIGELKSKGIASRRIYDIPVYRQESYIKISEWRWAKYIDYPDYSKLRLENTEEICRTHFEVPVHPMVSEEQAEYIGESLKKISREI